MAYIKTGGKIVKRYYIHYLKMAYILNIKPIEFHDFTIKAYDILEEECKQQKITI